MATNKVDYGAQVRAVMDNYRDRLERLNRADDLMPAAKARRIARLKNDTRKRFEEAHKAAEGAMQSDFARYWKAANSHRIPQLSSAEVTSAGVIKELRLNQLREDLLREMSRPGSSVADLLAQYEALGVEPAVEIIERYGADYARDPDDRADFEEMMAQRHPERVRAKQDLDELVAHQDYVRQGLALARDTAYRATQLDVDETTALQGQGSEGIE